MLTIASIYTAILVKYMWIIFIIFLDILFAYLSRNMWSCMQWMVQTASIAKLPVYGRIRPSLHGYTRVVLRLETARVRRCRSAGRDGNRTRMTAPVTRLHTVPGGSPSNFLDEAAARIAGRPGRNASAGKARKVRSSRQSLTSDVWYERGWTRRKGDILWSKVYVRNLWKRLRPRGGVKGNG